MDFNDTPEEAAFRAEVQQWLAANAPLKNAAQANTGSAAGTGGDRIDEAKAFQAKKAEAGYAAITWPEAYGGLGGTPIQEVIYTQEEANYDVVTGPFQIGLGMCIPTLLAWADETHLQRYVKPALYGEEIWCQLFSEPGAGSDVAGLQTRAERDGDDWIINGQKVWTSGAHYSDYGIIVTRSDPGVAKHKGLTFFFIDMKSPGIEVRPIKQMSGGAEFNEVFFNDVRVPDNQRLGAVGEGWKVSLTTLMNERLAIGTGSGIDVDELFHHARETELETGPALQNQSVREKLADFYIQSEGLKYTKYRTLTALSKGQTPGPESSIGKIISVPTMQDLPARAMELC